MLLGFLPGAWGGQICNLKDYLPLPANVALYGIANTNVNVWHSSEWYPFKLLYYAEYKWGQAHITWPQNTTPLALTTLDASFKFHSIGGDGADGFSFSYGDNRANRGYDYYEQAAYADGLTVAFKVRARYQNYGQVTVWWRYQKLATVSFDLWDGEWHGYWTYCRVTYTPQEGLNIRMGYSDGRRTWGEVTIFGTMNINWNPSDNWDFSFQGRTGGEYMDTYIGDVNIYGNTRSWPVIPSVFSLNEDTPTTFDFPVRDNESVYEVVLSNVTSSNPGLIPAGGVSFGGGGQNRTVTLTPQPNQNGDAWVEFDMSQGGHTARYGFTARVNAVNDPPAVSVVAPATSAQDTPMYVNATVSDIDNNAGDLVLTASSSDQALVPNGNLLVSGSGAARVVSVYPLALRHGSATITVKARDPSGAETSTSFSAAFAPDATDQRNYAPTAGKRGYALRLDGVDDFGWAPASPQLPTGSAMTVEAWVYPESNQASPYYNGLVVWGPRVATGTSFVLGMRSDGRLDLATWANDVLLSDQPLAFNAWSHVAVVVNGRSVKYHVNGALVRENTLPSVPNVQPGVLTIGCTDSPGRYFKGKLDEVRIWGRARSTEEINGNYRSRIAPTTPDLAAVFQADEGGGAVLRNGKVGGINAWLANGPLYEMVPEAAAISEDVVTEIALDGYDPEARPLTYEVQTAPAHGSLTFGRLGGSFKVRTFKSNTGLSTLESAEAVLMDAQARDVVFTGEFSQINFKNATGNAGDYSMDAPFPGVATNAADYVIEVTGVVRFPAAGDYTYCVGSDDGFRLTHAGVSLMSAGARSHTRSLAVVNVPAPGDFPLRLVFFQSSSAASLELSVAPGNRTTWSASDFRLLGADPHSPVQLRPSDVVSYHPFPNYQGSDTFTYRVHDGRWNPASNATVNLTINPVDDPPVTPPATALHFDGVDDYLKSGILDLANKSFTVEAWLRHDQPGKSHLVVSQGKQAANQGLHIGFRNSDVFTFAFWGNDLDTPVAYGDTNWHHWAATFEHTTKERRIYRDGVLVARDTAAASYQGSGELVLGRWIGGSSSWKGAVDEFRIWNVARSEAEIRSNKRRPVDPTAQLLLYYPLDEGRGRMAQDLASGKRDGILINGPHWEFNDSGFPALSDGSRGVIQLDGRNDALYVPPTPALEITNALTLEAWVCRQGTATDHYRNLIGHPAIDRYSLLVEPNTHVTFSIYSGGVRYGLGGPTLPLNQWVHLACTYDASEGVLRIYQGGELKAERSIGRLPIDAGIGQSLTIGGYPAYSGYTFPGAMAEVRVWSVARTVTQIQQGMTNGPASGTAGLLGYWRLNESEGYEARDASGNHRTALLPWTLCWARLAPAASPLPDFATLDVPEDSTTTLLRLKAMDVDGDGLAYEILNQPTHGALSGSGALRTYVPLHDFTGTDSFTYRTIANGLASAPLTVTLQVQDINDPPTITDFMNEVVEEDDIAPIQNFVIADVDDPVGSLTVTVQSSKRELIPEGNIVVSLTNGVGSLRITPVPGEIGIATITITVSDGKDPVSRSFDVEVRSTLAYGVVEIPPVTGKNHSAATALNDEGQVVGYSYQSVAGEDETPYHYTGFDSDPHLVALPMLPGALSGRAYGINNHLRMTGFSPGLGQQSHAFRLAADQSVPIDLGLLVGGTSSFGRGINDAGTVVGYADQNGLQRAFVASGNTVTLLPGVPSQVLESWGRAINNNNVLVGYARLNNGSTNAFLHDGTVFTLLPQRTNWLSSFALAINDHGVVAGYATRTDGSTVAAVYENGQWRELGDILGGRLAMARGINAFGRVVGTAMSTNGQLRAFVHDFGRGHDLNDLMPEDAAGWQLEDAVAINSSGQIVGNGIHNGQRRAFLLLPATEIGRRVFRPPLAIAAMPEIELIRKLRNDDTPQNSFYWSEYEAKLFAIRPVMAQIRWRTSLGTITQTVTNVIGGNIIVTSQEVPDTNRIETVSYNVWPRRPDFHAKDTPVQVEPNDRSFRYGFLSLIFTEINGAQVEPSAKSYLAPNLGYSVLHYLRTEGQPLNPQNQKSYFSVVRTLEPTDPKLYRSQQPWTVGDVLVNTNHYDYPGLTGFVLNEISPYDGVGEDRAYDRPTRTGSIIPVNVDTTATTNDLVVAWYHKNRIGVAWTAEVVQYTLRWPTNAPQIVIASTLGSGLLDQNFYRQARVYNQADPARPGFNPNEEHALMAPAGGGEGLFALRNDLNAVFGNLSAPFALLKYKHPDVDQWRIQPFEILRTNIYFNFIYEGEAAKEIQPPMPLTVLPLCTNSYPVAGPYWQSYLNKIYARASGTNAGLEGVQVRYFYPLQPGFYYDTNITKQTNISIGSPLAWLDRRPGGTEGVPVDVFYVIKWPVDVPELQIGQTLGKPAAGLPGVMDMARVQVVYDSLWGRDWNSSSAAGLARLYDPLSSRIVSLPAGFRIPDIIRRELAPGGLERFPDLPYPLRLRLFHDPINKRLIFRGYYNEAGAGQPLLLPNIISEAERAQIQGLDDAFNSVWDKTVAELYKLTRNPNMIDRDGDRVYDDAFLVGLTTVLETNLTTLPGPNMVLSLPPMASIPPRTLFTNAIWGVTATDEMTQVRMTNMFYSTLMGIPLFLDPYGNVTLSQYRWEPQMVTRYTSKVIGTVSSRLVPESFNAGPKVLSSALGDVPPNAPLHDYYLAFETNGLQRVTLPAIRQPLEDFTIACWAKISAGNTGTLFTTVSGSYTVTNLFTNSVTHLVETNIGLVPGLFLRPQPGGRQYQVSDSPVAPDTYAVLSAEIDTEGWHHIALVRRSTEDKLELYVDAQQVGTVTNAVGVATLEGLRLGGGFRGALDDFQIWTQAMSPGDLDWIMRNKQLGYEPGLLANWRIDDGTGLTVSDWGPFHFHGTLDNANGAWQSGTPAAGMDYPPRYLVLAENNDPELAGLPVSLHVIRLEGGPFAGELKVIYPDNPLDERLTLRHSSDFGGRPELFEFEWYYHPATAGFDPVEMPDSPTGTWIRLDGGMGKNYITLGEGAQASLLTLSDNWFVMRYRGYNVDGQTNWSRWIGDPSAGTMPRAQFAEGWTKRVIFGLNPYDQRTADFHDNAASTIVSMIRQAGPRYEGPVALNPDASYLNSLGLIEIYQTVLERSKALSVNGTPAVNYDPANTALLLAASHIADLYALLGNEAYADAQDPTIGYTTSSAEYGTLASSIFAFQNQLESPLEEELVLLRGRDDSSAGVAAPPVYNRLFWNFTRGEGELAYATVYNITDQNQDGGINAEDAKLVYPQGHGDAWGHYLTATKTYYDLLRNPHFTWIPRSEYVLLAGVPIKVDFLDERKFATIAAAKARTGAEIVDLTYRLNYVDDPEGQWQGYEDPDGTRAWGVAEWGRRAGLGAYFDWLTGNAIIPAVDQNPEHKSIDRIDRTTVRELAEIRAQLDSIQSQIDKADRGLNPLGLAQGVVPFDIDPAQFETATGQRHTHFEQVFERAVGAMKNALITFNEANLLTESLRLQQDTEQQFNRQVEDQERGYKNRLLELYGYPYAGDIGPGRPYPDGYDGPDLYHYMYLDTSDATATAAAGAAVSQITAYFTPFRVGLTKHGFHFADIQTQVTNVIAPNAILQVQYPLTAGEYAFAAPSSWGRRRAAGELQISLLELRRSELSLKRGLENYSNLMADLKDMADLLQARHNLRQEFLELRREKTEATVSLKAVGLAAEITKRLCNSKAQTSLRLGNVAMEGFPKVVGLATDCTSAGRAAVLGAALAAAETLETASAAAEIAGRAAEGAIALTTRILDVKLEQAQYDYETRQKLLELSHILRKESEARLELLQLAEVISQNQGRYLAVLARGQRLLEERIVYRQRTAADVQKARYRDMTFRTFRNDALQKYRAQFDLAARFVYLAATAYDYEVNLLGQDNRAARRFFEDIIRQRALGQMADGQPVLGKGGLATAMAQMRQNFDVLKPQLGLNNPSLEVNEFSFRQELYRIATETSGTNALGVTSAANWLAVLQGARAVDLWQVPEFRRYCRPFAPESAGPQPGLVLRFPSTIRFGQNFFGWPLGPGDHSFDASQFASKLRTVAVYFEGYEGLGVSHTPRVYFVPVGQDILRAPDGNDFAERHWQVVDQQIPVPLPIGGADLSNPDWIPAFNSLGGSFANIRRHSSLRAHDYATRDDEDANTDSRLIGRSVWNTQWLLIVPGATLYFDPDVGLDRFIGGVSDIKLRFETYSYSGN